MEGSHAYGTSTPESDVDMRGIFCADPINLLTPFFPVKEIELNDEEDTKFYELSHFMKLLVDQNPNIVQILWVRNSDVVETSPAYELLRSEREKLLSSKIAFTTSGYAHAQLKRIKGHNKWIMTPMPEQKPMQSEFISLVQWFGNLKILPSTFDIRDYDNNHMAVSYGNDLYGLYRESGKTLFDSRGVIKSNFEGSRDLLPLPRAVFRFNRQQYIESTEKHKNYWNWKENRNEKRSKLEEEFGFDTKHAMHLVRLMRMGYEALTTGQINVYRNDAKELLDIRNGSMTYEEILEYAEMMDNKIKSEYNKTNLRKRVDLKDASRLIMEVQQLVWNPEK